MASLTGCQGTGSAADKGGTLPPSPSKPKIADEAETDATLTVLDEELTSVLMILEDLDLIDEADLTP